MVYVQNAYRVTRGWLSLPHADRVWLELVGRNSDVQVKCWKRLQVQIDRWSPTDLFEADVRIMKGNYIPL